MYSVGGIAISQEFNLQALICKTGLTMNQPDYVVIQEGESVEYSREKQMLFEPSATVRIGMGGYSTVYKVVIPAVHFRYKTEHDSPVELNQVRYHLASIRLICRIRDNPLTNFNARRLLYLWPVNGFPTRLISNTNCYFYRP